MFSSPKKPGWYIWVPRLFILTNESHFQSFESLKKEGRIAFENDVEGNISEE